MDDRALIEVIQQSVPLVRRPFEAIGQTLGYDESVVISRIKALRLSGIIREISGIFDAASLGYAQALIALAVAPEKLESAGQLAASHPGVSHCYGRQGRYNLWFTLAVSPRSSLGLNATAKTISDASGAGAILLLPTLTRYKLSVFFGDQAARVAGAPSARGEGVSPSVTQPRFPARSPDLRQIAAIRALQQDLPAEAEPFAAIAASAGLDADDLLVRAADFLAIGWMRRYAAVLHHQAAGAAANVLVAWDAPDEQVDVAGALAARSPAVSHCYRRPRAGDWPYNLYTMIHGASPQECQRAVAAIAAATGLARHEELWTTRQFRKSRVPLFSDDEAKWEAKITKATKDKQ